MMANESTRLEREADNARQQARIMPTRENIERASALRETADRAANSERQAIFTGAGRGQGSAYDYARKNKRETRKGRE